MTNEQLAQLLKLSKELTHINESLQSDFDNEYSLQVVDTEDSIIIVGNSEGLINLATSLIELALSRKEGRHYHFGAGALDNCVKGLEILYKSVKCE